MDFATRLYRHVQKSAASKYGIHEQLAKLKHFRVSLISEGEITDRINLQKKNTGHLPKTVILLMEAALIHEYQPEFQRGKDEPKSN